MQAPVRLIALSLVAAFAAVGTAAPVVGADKRPHESSKAIKGSNDPDKEKGDTLRGADAGHSSNPGVRTGSDVPLSDLSIIKNPDKASPGKYTDKASPK